MACLAGGDAGSAEAGARDVAYSRTLDSSGTPSQALIGQLDQLFNDAQRLAVEAQRTSEDEYQQGRQLLVVFLLLLVLVGLAAALLISRSITQPLDLLRDRIDGLAGAGSTRSCRPGPAGMAELRRLPVAVKVFKQSMIWPGGAALAQAPQIVAEIAHSANKPTSPASSAARCSNS